MKTKLFTLLACLGLFFVSCTFVEQNNPDNPSQQKVHELTIDVLSEDIHKDSPYIRLMAECDEWILFDIKHDGLENDSSRSFVFLRKDVQIGYYLYATTEFVLMSQFTDDPTESLSAGNVLMTTSDGNYTYVRVIKNILGDYEILSEKAIPNEKAAAQMPQKNNDYFTGLGKSIYGKISEHFKAGAEDINDATGILAWLPCKVGASGSSIGSIWSAVAFNASLHQIYEYNPDLKEALSEEIEVDDRFFVKMALCSNRYIGLAVKVYDVITKGTKIGMEWLSQNKVEVEDDDYGSVVYPMFSSSRVIDTNRNVQIIAEQTPAYIVTHSVSAITETSAEVYVSINATGSQSFISSMGLVYTNYITGEKKEIELSSLSQTVKLTGLTPCTTYLCYAYVKSMGETYSSSAEFFNTEGKLQLTPSSLNFSSAGGTEIVSLSLTPEYIASLQVSGPSWCQLSYNSPAAAFIVTVPESNTEREGVINVTVKLVGGETKTAQLPITQTAITWDNTTWKFGGNVTTTGYGETNTGYLEMILQINDIANHDYSLTSSGVSFAFSVSSYDESHINGSFSYTYDGATAVWNVVITRTSETTATFSLDCSAGAVHQYGTLNGTLIE